MADTFGGEQDDGCDWCERFSILLSDSLNELIRADYLTYDFPEHCPDNEMPCGCDQDRMKQVFYGESGDRFDRVLNFPTRRGLFAMIEFLYRHSSEPTKTIYHSYFQHRDIAKTSKELGKQRVEMKINSLFDKLEIPFELKDGKVSKCGDQIFADLIESTVFDTGDKGTDSILETAIALFKNTESQNRTLALEKLWDAWERIKTLEAENKKIGVETLIKNGIKGEEMRKIIELEAKTLTDIGNNFQIRHFERNKIKLNSEDLDYLYYRLFNLILRLLAGTKRIKQSE